MNVPNSLPRLKGYRFAREMIAYAVNTVFSDHFSKAPPARACVQAAMMVDCKIELDCVAYRGPSDIA